MTWIFELPPQDVEELDREAVFAEMFLDAGGALTRAEWMQLEDVDLQALILAAQRRRLRLLVDQATANNGPAGIAQLMSSQDGGEMRLMLAVKKAARRLSGQA